MFSIMIKNLIKLKLNCTFIFAGNLVDYFLHQQLFSGFYFVCLVRVQQFSFNLLQTYRLDNGQPFWTLINILSYKAFLCGDQAVLSTSFPDDYNVDEEQQKYFFCHLSSINQSSLTSNPGLD